MNWMPQMSYEKAMNTAFLFVGGALSIARGSLWYSFESSFYRESVSGICKTTALVFSLAAVVQIAVTKIFEELGVEDHYNDLRCLLVRVFTILSSVLIAGAAAVGFGFTKNAYTALTASAIGFHILGGAGAIALGVHNFMGGNHQYFL